jgi:ribosome-associated protein
MNKNKIDDSDFLATCVVAGMQEKKGKDIKVLDLRKLNSSFADFFVVCHGNSDRQVNAIVDSVEELIRDKCKEKPYHIEGKERAEWILMDYINVVVHVFVEEKRNFYAIEDLWGDAEITEFQSID